MRLLLILLSTTLVSLQVWAEDSAWPRAHTADGVTITVYAPEVVSVVGTNVRARGAFSLSGQSSGMVFGAATFSAEFEPVSGTELRLSRIEIEAIRLPDSLMQHQDTVVSLLRNAIASWDLRTTKAELQSVQNGRSSSGIVAADLKNEPPVILVRERPALLVVLDGEASLKTVENTPYQYVQNTAVPILFDPSTKRYYLPNGDDWYETADLMGAWKTADRVPPEIAKLVSNQDRTQESTVHDLEVVVATVPTELIAFNGAPEWKPLVGTELLYASNTESSVFTEVASGAMYVLLSGRWFRASQLRGPWTFVASADLPASFAQIPEGGSKAEVRSAVAGTVEAEEAVLDAYTPTVASVDRASATITVVYDGDPWFAKISGTSMEYAVNTTTPVIRVDGQYYAVESGVWYRSSSATGPWVVSDHRPPSIDEIPSSSPVSNVKYVYVYSSTPTVVYVGYTPGYYGTYVYGPTVVYGTGWYYNPWYGAMYYPRPVTYGFHVHYNPYYGWSYGCSYSSGWLHVSVGYRPPYYHHYHPAYYRPPAYHHPAYRPPAYRPPSYRPPAGSRPPSGTRPPSNRPISPSAPTARPAYQPTARPSTYNRPSASSRVPSSAVQHPTSGSPNRSAFRPQTSGATPRATPRGGGGRRR